MLYAKPLNLEIKIFRSYGIKASKKANKKKPGEQTNKKSQKPEITLSSLSLEEDVWKDISDSSCLNLYLI